MDTDNFTWFDNHNKQLAITCVYKYTLLDD